MNPHRNRVNDGTRLLTIHKTFVRTVEGERKLLALGCKLWDVESGRLIRDLPISRLAVTAAIPFSPDSRVFLVGVAEGLEVRDSGTGEKRVTLPLGGFPTLRAAFSHDGARLVTGGRRGPFGEPTRTVGWDLATGKLLGESFPGGNGVFSPDRKRRLIRLA